MFFNIIGNRSSLTPSQYPTYHARVSKSDLPEILLTQNEQFHSWFVKFYKQIHLEDEKEYIFARIINSLYYIPSLAENQLEKSVRTQKGTATSK